MATVRFKHNSSKSTWGRFGGGWQWVLGFQASARFRTIILNLLVFSVRIERGNKESRAT